MSSMESRVEAAAGRRPIKVGLRFNVAMKQRCYGRSRMLEQFMADPFYNPVVPDHVPPALVHDFNMYDPAEPGEDVFEAFRSLHERGLPEIFWTRTNGGHWVIRKGAAIAVAVRVPSRFSSTTQIGRASCRERVGT